MIRGKSHGLIAGSCAADAAHDSRWRNRDRPAFQSLTVE